MSDIKEILVPIDFTHTSEKALDYALEFAKKLGARITLVHAYELPVYGFPDGALVASAEVAGRILESAQAGLTVPDGEQRRHREDVAHGIGAHRHRRTEHADQATAERRTAQLRAGPSQLELGIAIDQLIAPDEGGQIRLIRDIEEDGQHAADEGDDVELGEGEVAQCTDDRDRSYGQGAPDVGDHQDGPAAADSVDPDACRQPDDDERCELHS